MGYEIEMSFDLRKQKNISSLLDATVELAENNNCNRHFKFTECEKRLEKEDNPMYWYFVLMKKGLMK